MYRKTHRAANHDGHRSGKPLKKLAIPHKRHLIIAPQLEKA